MNLSKQLCQQRLKNEIFFLKNLKNGNRSAKVVNVDS